MDSSSVLILGANGRFGHAVCQAFSAAGWHVLAQCRRPPKYLPATAKALIIDALDTPALCRAAKGVDVVVNALSPQYTQWQQLALPLATSALTVAKTSGALLMMPGNVYNFGDDLPSELYVKTPQIGSHSKARIRIAMEQQLHAATEDGIDSIIVRAGDFFGGPIGGAWFDLAISQYLPQGKFVYPGRYDIPHAWAYLPDLAACFVKLAEKRQRSLGVQVFHFPGNTVTGDELYQALQIVYGRPLRQRAFPWYLLYLAAPFSPMIRATVRMRYLWQKPHRLCDDALLEYLGSVPQTPLLQALADALTALGLPVPES
ncbi:NAD(P)H-binding protein [Serratia sp. DD3]|uniref:NAD(P)H-binding protein n=1 Tax=Serratia sp. DD3 TaxID=1410619 RepID=UPI0003C4F1CB|nr:NAD(P)H-binding protein [Serratia sp. DD3]KEY60288.1 putative NADH-flavin reductase [Serratia sp. DD3]